MWFRTELQLIQPAAGYRLGVDLSKEKWVLLKFHSAYISALKPPPYASYSEIVNELVPYPIMGRYFIVTNQTGAPDTSYIIGRQAPKENKVWQYNPKTQYLILGTVETWTGTASNGNENTTNITEDVVLYDALLTRKGFVVNGGGLGGHGNGFVNIASWTNRPFEARSLFWTAV